MPILRLLRFRYAAKRHNPILATNAKGKRTERSIVPTLESPDCAASLAIPAVREDVGEDVEEVELSGEKEASEVRLFVEAVSLDDSLEVDDVAVAAEDAAEEDGEEAELLEVLGLAALVLAGLLEPPYVHPSPKGIDGP
mgnify:FL=1